MLKRLILTLALVAATAALVRGLVNALAPAAK